MADGDKEQDDELDLEPTETEGEDVQAEADEPQGEQETEPEGQQPEVREPEQVQPQPRQVPRSETRIRTLLEENRRKDTELADFRRRLDELTRQVAQPAPQRESPEQRAARFAVMTPQEQISESLRESEARWEQRMQGMQLQTAETADRTAFQTKCTVDPLYAKWAPKVEGKLAELRTRGSNVEREVLLKFLIGEAALERRTSKEGKREVQAAAQRVTAQRVRTGNSGSDTPAQRRQNTSLERRLENVNI